MARKLFAKRVKIKSVSFRANVSTAKYEHIHIEATADVPDGERPEAVLDQLKTFVAKELKFAKEGEVVPEPKVRGRFRI